MERRAVGECFHLPLRLFSQSSVRASLSILRKQGQNIFHFLYKTTHYRNTALRKAGNVLVTFLSIIRSKSSSLCSRSMLRESKSSEQNIRAKRVPSCLIGLVKKKFIPVTHGLTCSFARSMFKNDFPLFGLRLSFDYKAAKSHFL